jgi:hypothetical protein
MKSIRTVSALFLALMYAGCGGKDSVPAASGVATPQPRSNNLDVGEDRFQIGKTVAADGKVLNDTDQFTAGDSIYISFVVRNAPAGTYAKVTWKRIDGDVKMGEEQKTLPAGGFVSFAVKDTSTWPPGRYRVEKWFGREASGATPPWTGLGTKDLTISRR